MRTGIVNKERLTNEKGYQSVKLYIPNDTLMGLNTKANELKEESKLLSVNRKLKTTTKRPKTTMNLQPSNSSLNRFIKVQKIN